MRHTLHRIVLAATLLAAMPFTAHAQGGDPPFVKSTSNALRSLGPATEDPQPLPPERLKEIKARKAAYITTKLALTEQEAQKFWPIYNQFDEERETDRRALRELHKSMRKDGAPMTEAQANELLEKGLASRQREIDLERSYTEKFKKSIGAVKTVELHKAERDFNKEVLRRYRERMEGGKGKPGGGGHERH